MSADNKWLALACSSDKMFARFTKLIGRDELAEKESYGLIAKRLANASKINLVVSEWMANRSAQEILELCEQNDVPCAPVNNIADIFKDEQYAARENLLEMSSEKAAKVVIPNVIPRLSKTPGMIESLGPELGSSNADILSDLLGLDADEIENLRKQKII